MVRTESADDEILAPHEPDTGFLDLEGKVVVPGFIDVTGHDEEVDLRDRGPDLSARATRQALADLPDVRRPASHRTPTPLSPAPGGTAGRCCASAPSTRGSGAPTSPRPRGGSGSALHELVKKIGNGAGAARAEEERAA